MTNEEKKVRELAILLFEVIDDLRDIDCEDMADSFAKRVDAILGIPPEKNP